MILSAPLFHLSILFSVELLALTGALFLLLYIKKENFGKLYSYIAAAITGLVLLMMAASFVGAICMHCCRDHRGGEEKRMFIHREMGPEMEMGRGMGMHHEMGMGHHREMMGMGEGCPEMGKDGCSGMGECSGAGMSGCEKTEGCEMECCKNKSGHCDMKPGKMEMHKDSIVVKKPGKK